MIKILKAKSSESLDKEWLKVNPLHYGRDINWIEKKFRFKAVEGKELLGTIEGKLEGDIIYIAALMTKESMRGQGIGTLLIHKAEEFGKKYGARKSWLLTGKDWPSNVFYKKIGFKEIAVFPDFFFNKDFVVYVRLINS